MSPNDADGMANSVDQDQTAIWAYTVCPGKSVRKLRIILVNKFKKQTLTIYLLIVLISLLKFIAFFYLAWIKVFYLSHKSYSNNLYSMLICAISKVPNTITLKYLIKLTEQIL